MSFNMINKIIKLLLKKILTNLINLYQFIKLSLSNIFMYTTLKIKGFACFLLY